MKEQRGWTLGCRTTCVAAKDEMLRLVDCMEAAPLELGFS